MHKWQYSTFCLRQHILGQGQRNKSRKIVKTKLNGSAPDLAWPASLFFKSCISFEYRTVFAGENTDIGSL